jgi:hypothetical protein
MAAEASTRAKRLEQRRNESSMAEKPPFPVIREAVASFATKAELRDAVTRVMAANFKPTDLSLLATHDSLEVAGDVPAYRGTPGSSLLAGLTDEVSFLAPLTVAGIVLLTGGPVAAAIAALVGAGVGTAAIKEMLDYYTANRHSAEFARALEKGAVLLWVRVDDPALEATAVRLLEEAGGRNAHIHARPAKTGAPGKDAPAA